MTMRGCFAGYVAVLVVVMGVGTAAAFPRGAVGMPEGALRMGPLAGATPVAALTEDEAVAMLTAEGYVVVDTHRTWLGRIVITAEGKDGTREIVLHPYDGQVLRDAIVDPAPPLVADVPADAGPDAEAPMAAPAADTGTDADDADTPPAADQPSDGEEPAP